MGPRKLLLRPGVYAAPQGLLHATSDRVRSWAEKFAEMNRAGIKIPVSWGHQPDAWPLDPRASDPQRARREYHLSAYNAGYLSHMDCGKDGLEARLDCPGVEMDGDKLVCWRKLPDGSMVKTAIAEVSVAIKDWRDGTGKLWDDAIIHVALTPLPVAHGTGGFQMSTLPVSDVCKQNTSGFTLSLSSLLYTLSGAGTMAKEKDDLEEMEEEPEQESAEESSEAPEEGSEGLDGLEASPEGMEIDMPMPPPAAPPMTETSPVNNYFAEALQILSRRGIKLPDDTTPANFFERLVVAGFALEHNEAQEPMEPDLQMPEMEQAQEGDVNSEPEGNYDGSQQITEEQRPVMMSLSTAKTRAEKVMLAREQERHKSQLKKRIESLKKRGVQPARLAKLEKQVDGYQLSLTDEGGVVEQSVDFLLSALEDMAPAKHPLKGMQTANIHPRPSGGRSEHEALQAQEEAGDMLAELAGVPRKSNKERS